MLKFHVYTLVIAFLALQSCSKSSESASNGDSNISISLTSIEDESSLEVNPSEVEDEIGKSAFARARAATPRATEAKKLTIVELPEFDIIDDVQYPVLQDSRSEKSSTKARSVSRAASPMPSGISYRILMYETSGVLAANRVATAGSALQFQVDAGKTYNWYAVSINETSVPDINANGVIASTALANKDILYASGQISTSFGDNTLTVAFRRLTSKIEVDLNARGIFAQIQNSTSIDIGTISSGSFAKINRIGDLNMRTAAFSNIVDAPAITATNMSQVDAALANAVKKASFHTISTSTVAAGNLRVRLNTLNTILDNGNTRTFTAGTLLPITGAITPTIGTRHIIIARLIESPVNINGVRWARTNLLYYSEAGQVDRYRFRPDNEYTIGDLNREYWNKGTTTPAGTTFSATYDPCNSVYPNNVWSTPTDANRITIGNPTRTSRTLVGGTQRFMAHWDQAAGTPNNSAYTTNSLDLLYIGYYDNGQSRLVQQGHNLAVGGLAVSEYWQAENATSTSARARSQLTQPTSGTYNYGTFDATNQASRVDRKPYRCVRRPTT